MKRLLLILVAAVVLTSCGGSSDGGTASPREWMDGWCSAMSGWVAVSRTGVNLENEVQGALTAGNPQQAKALYIGYLEDVEAAARKLQADLSGLPTPDVNDGQRVSNAMKSVGDEIVTFYGRVLQEARTLPSDDAQGFALALSAFTTELQQGKDPIQETFGSLEGSPSEDDLTQAFDESSICADLLESYQSSSYFPRKNARSS